MNNKLLSKIITIIIYFLTAFLICLILYNMFLLINRDSAPNEPPRNSIKVSPISGEEIHSVSNMNNIYKVKFKNFPIDKLSLISKASIIYDNYDESTNSNLYSALFLDENFKRDDSMLTISNISTNDLPNITFVDNSSLKKYSYFKLIDSITITNSSDAYSNFFYYGGAYHHFSKSLEDTDSISNKPITYQNIVIDASSQKENTLYVYSCGMFREYSKTSKLFLSKGKTFWFTLNKNCSIYFSFSNLDIKMKYPSDNIR